MRYSFSDKRISLLIYLRSQVDENRGTEFHAPSKKPKIKYSSCRRTGFCHIQWRNNVMNFDWQYRKVRRWKSQDSEILNGWNEAAHQVRGSFQVDSINFGFSIKLTPGTHIIPDLLDQTSFLHYLILVMASVLVKTKERNFMLSRIARDCIRNCNSSCTMQRNVFAKDIRLSSIGWIGGCRFSGFRSHTTKRVLPRCRLFLETS